MSISITKAANLANQALNKNPNIVLKIDGVETLYSAAIIRKLALYGDNIYYGDENFFYGGSVPIENQENYISFDKGTTTDFTQQINIETGIGSSVLSYQLALIDKNGEITKLITPGIVIDDLLGERCTISYGFESTVYPDDYVTLFKGSVDSIDSGSGIVKINVIASQKKQLANTFTKSETELFSDITLGDVVIPLVDASSFKLPQIGPDGVTVDPSLEYYVRIDDEIMQYTGISVNNLTGVLRARLGTLAVAHAEDAAVSSYYRLVGDAMELTLKFMLSGVNGPYVDSLLIESFKPTTNIIFFKNQDLKADYNLTAGDFITITGAVNPANNLTAEPIVSFEATEDGFGFNVVVAAALVLENASSAVASIRSKFDVYGEDRGLAMIPDEVDIDQHIALKESQLAGVIYDFSIEEDLENGKEFIDKELYNPISCFGLTRQARASVGIQAPPLPSQEIKILNDTNISNADGLVIKRQSGKNFFNGVIYDMDYLRTDQEKSIRREVVLSGPSIAKFGNKIPKSYLTIPAKGFRADNGSRSIAQSLGRRRLAVYEFGAEFLPDVQVNLNPGLTIEPGDIVLLDLASLKVSDKESGTRAGESRLFRVDRKKFNIKTGKIGLSLIDTNFDKNSRFSLIGPASTIKTGLSTTQLIIQPGVSSSRFGNDEWRKWDSYKGINVTIRDANFTQVSPPVRLNGITGNTITVDDLGFTPTAGMIMEFSAYSSLGVEKIVDTVTLLFSSVTDEDNPFPDGKPAYKIS